MKPIFHSLLAVGVGLVASSSLLAAPISLYSGGSEDGYAVEIINQLVSFPGSTPTRFRGNGFDGYVKTTVTNISNPLKLDSDGDGLPDWWEKEFYFTIVDAEITDNTDGDDFNSLQEYWADTIPTNELSYLGINHISNTNGQFLIKWQGGQKAFQYVARGGVEDSQSWDVIWTNLPPTMTNEMMYFNDGGDTTQWFRIQTER